MYPPPPPPPPPPQYPREYFRALRPIRSSSVPGGVTPLLNRTANACNFRHQWKICIKGGTRRHEWRMFVEIVKCTKVDYWIHMYTWYENDIMKTKQKPQKLRGKGDFSNAVFNSNWKSQSQIYLEQLPKFPTSKPH